MELPVSLFDRAERKQCSVKPDDQLCHCYSEAMLATRQRTQESCKWATCLVDTCATQWASTPVIPPHKPSTASPLCHLRAAVPQPLVSARASVARPLPPPILCDSLATSPVDLCVPHTQ